MKYRADIDGLRALAVLPVIFYHMGLSRYMPGGFIGVDIFFVISGYLITTIIAANIDNKSYSLADFYNRRIKRIFPVLFVLYITVAILSLLTQFPAESRIVGNSIASSVFFVSNILFYYSSGYFDTASESNLLLHTWSLSVEEQFYVLFPIILFMMRKLTKPYRLVVLGLIACASFITSVYLVNNDASGAYYLVHSRAWELMLGAILAVKAPPILSSKIISELIGIVGLVLIVLSCFLLNKATPFPGLTALPACLGSAAIIYSGTANTLVSRLLGNPLLRFFGLISYSLYLWHWPVWVFASERISMQGTAGTIIKVVLILVSILIATLSWHFIEKPFRTKRPWLSQRNVLAGGVAAMLLMTCFAFSLATLNRVIWKPPQLAESINDYINYGGIKFKSDERCFLEKVSVTFDRKNCLALSNEKKNILVLGDSHAAHLMWGLQEKYPNINFLQATASGCKPYIGTKGEIRCTEVINAIFDDFLPHNKVDSIIISARWKIDEIPFIQRTVEKLLAYTDNIIVMGRIAEFEQALPRLIAQGILKSPDDIDSYVAKFERKELKEIDDAFVKATWPANVKFISTYEIMHNQCKTLLINGVPKQFDYGHLTAEGSACLATNIDIH